MKRSPLVDRLVQHEGLNFFVTNRIPRRLATRFMGWFSRIEQPLVRDFSMAAWRFFAEDLNLHEAQKTEFTSLHDCFTRKLKPDARPIDPAPDVLTSPCDAIVVANGAIDGTTLLQAKGVTYTLEDLLGDARLAAAYAGGRYATLRLSSTMYHWFHAPCDCRVHEVTYIAGDTWNVNPAALTRVERLYCRNERVVVPLQLERTSQSVVLVAVGAILVGSIQLTFLETTLNLKYRGPRRIFCAAALRKGDAMGCFHHGSTVIVLATPGLEPCRTVQDGGQVLMGQPLFRHR
jgi:phosphatidylserine decarboxylase